MKAVVAVVLCILAAATPVAADGSGSGEEALPQIVVPLGSTVETDVGAHRGVHCDDLAIIAVELKTRNDRNYFEVTGKAIGETLCKVGTDPTLPGVLFKVRVVASKKGGVK